MFFFFFFFFFFFITIVSRSLDQSHDSNRLDRERMVWIFEDNPKPYLSDNLDS